MIIKLKDGSVKEYGAPTTAAEITKDISMGLYRNACAVLIDGKVADLRTTVENDCNGVLIMIEAILFSVRN